jgi:hypothetical protein
METAETSENKDGAAEGRKSDWSAAAHWNELLDLVGASHRLGFEHGRRTVFEARLLGPQKPPLRERLRLQEMANQLEAVYWDIPAANKLSRRTLRLLADELREKAGIGVEAPGITRPQGADPR